VGAMQRRKGGRIEREIVNLHKEEGVHAERVPLSGATHHNGAGHDVDVYPWGTQRAPLCCEVKGRGTGGGFKTIETWLADNDVLFLRRDNTEPLAVMPWRVYLRLIRRTVP
jgi:Holliday junction resolvase